MTATMTKEEQVEPAAPTNEGIPPALDTGMGPETTGESAVDHATNHVPDSEVPTDVDTSAMIAEAGT